MIRLVNLLPLEDERPRELRGWLDSPRTRKLLAKIHREGWEMAAERASLPARYPRRRTGDGWRDFPPIKVQLCGRWFRLGAARPLHEMERPLLFYYFLHEVRDVLRDLASRRWDDGSISDGEWVWASAWFPAREAVTDAMTSAPDERPGDYMEVILAGRLGDASTHHTRKELILNAPGRRCISIAEDGTMSLGGSDPFHDGFLPTLEGTRAAWIRVCPVCHLLFLAARQSNDGCREHKGAITVKATRKKEKAGRYDMARYRSAEARESGSRRSRAKPGSGRDE